jgi:hypothetical protein
MSDWRDIPPPGPRDGPEVWDLYKALRFLIEKGCTREEISQLLLSLSLDDDDPKH